MNDATTLDVDAIGALVAVADLQSASVPQKYSVR